MHAGHMNRICEKAVMLVTEETRGSGERTSMYVVHFMRACTHPLYSCEPNATGLFVSDMVVWIAFTFNTYFMITTPGPLKLL